MRMARRRSGRQLCASVRASAAAASPGGEAPFGGGSGVEGSQSAGGFLGAFWKFLRPHTIRGTILGASAVTARALLETPQLIDWALLPKAIMGVIALLCGNGYIVGINQIYDVDIDVVNKPFLPIASGRGAHVLLWAHVQRPCGQVPHGAEEMMRLPAPLHSSSLFPTRSHPQASSPPGWPGS